MTDPVFVDLSTAPPPEGSAPAHGAPVPPITFDGPAAYPDEVIEQLTAEALPIIARYPQARSALLPLLHLVQSNDGRLTRAGIEFCAAQLDLTPAQVASVATFYSMYRRTPTGEYLVGVCTNTLCATLGGDEILRSVCEHLGVEPGDTTADHRITVEHVECNAACDFAPVVMVNWEFFDDQTPESTIELIEDLRAGVEVTPARARRDRDGGVDERRQGGLQMLLTPAFEERYGDFQVDSVTQVRLRDGADANAFGRAFSWALLPGLGISVDAAAPLTLAELASEVQALRPFAEAIADQIKGLDKGKTAERLDKAYRDTLY